MDRIANIKQGMKNISVRRIFMVSLFIFIGYLFVFILIQRNSPDYESNMFRVERQIDRPSYHCDACIRLDLNSKTLTRFGIPYQFIGGQIDYFRVPLIYWEDRLQKAKAAGLDVVEFYIPWNFHERSPGSFEFSGQRNISHYLELIKKSGLLAVVRPGPYICAEWTLGGIPPWLWYQSSFVQLRTSDPEFMRPVTRWFGRLLPILKPYVQENGGPIFMAQIENEYGYHTKCDLNYMAMLYKLLKLHLGGKIIYFTVDAPELRQLMCHTDIEDDVIQTIDFGPCDLDLSCEIKYFHMLDALGPNKPLINSEFYTGWFDNWGKLHKTRSIAQLVYSFWRQISYSNRVSLSFYMFHGGTSFGLWNGANTDPYRPQTTTYDYDAPISEAGDLTEKYLRIREAIFQFKRQKPPPLPRNTTKSVYPSAFLKPVSHLLWLLSNGTESVEPVLMENLKQYEGMMVYATNISESNKFSRMLSTNAILDAIHIFSKDPIRGFSYHGSAYRDSPDQSMHFPYTGKGKTLYLLVENRGYVNYGPEVSTDRKGIMHPVYLGGDLLKHWIMYPICFNKDGLSCPGTNILDQLRNPGPGRALYEMPRMGLIYRGSLTIKTETELADTFVEPKSFERGLLYINSILLGRFDQAHGPQLTLFVPKSFLKFGINDIVIVDLSGMITNGKIVFRDKPIWLLGAMKF